MGNMFDVVDFFGAEIFIEACTKGNGGLLSLRDIRPKASVCPGPLLWQVLYFYGSI